MTLERAKPIYRRDYWGPAGCDAVPHGIRFDLFDMAANSGVKPRGADAAARGGVERPGGGWRPRASHPSGRSDVPGAAAHRSIQRRAAGHGACRKPDGGVR